MFPLKIIFLLKLQSKLNSLVIYTLKRAKRTAEYKTIGNRRQACSGYLQFSSDLSDLDRMTSSRILSMPSLSVNVMRDADQIQIIP